MSQVRCSGQCERAWQLGLIDSNNGEIVWSEHSTNSQLNKAIKTAMDSHNEGYCLIYCFDGHQIDEDTDYYTEKDIWEKHSPQILNFPPSLDHNSAKQHKNTNVNFNFIFIDSVSRHHFYRSLPKTVKMLDNINSQHNRRKDTLLDYQLFQAVNSRTFETLQALFAGFIDPYKKPFRTQAMPDVKLDIDSMFGKLQSLDYHTLWVEDVCPYWEWGLSKDLHVYKKKLTKKQSWKKFKKSLKQSSIESVGNTFTSCGILSVNGHPDPFHGPEKLCYRGQHQHEYQLDYLKKYQTTMQGHKENYLSFFETNIGHEDHGLRVQFLDTALAEYVKFTQNLYHTITVIFSDHGNAYGSYIEESREGRLEAFHPFLFVIIPEDVQSMSLFSAAELNALIVNQQRLISVLDFHYTITYIIGKISGYEVMEPVSAFNQQFNVTEAGLLQVISEHRTCSLIPRVVPNLCICAGYDVTSEDHDFDFDFILAQHFVGVINNEIQSQRFSDLSKSVKGGNQINGVSDKGGFGKCSRLKVGTMKNIQTNKIDVSIY